MATCRNHDKITENTYGRVNKRS